MTQLLEGSTMAFATRELCPPHGEARFEMLAAFFEKLARALESEAVSLAGEMARHIGKPVYYGKGEVLRTADMLRVVIQRARQDALTNHGDGPEVRHRPLGRVAVITPWNNPFYIPLGKIAPALLYGNTVVWKPAPAAELLAGHVMRLAAEAGPLPEELLSCREGDGRIALELMNDASIDAVTLTGSLQTGRAVQEICTRRCIPLQAELGGNNAAIIWEDADLKGAARAVAEGAFAQAGQRCTANRRVVVHRACRERFLELLQKETAALPWGDPLDPAIRIGPLVSVAHRDRVAAMVASGVADLSPVMVPHALGPVGARGHEGTWHPATIICCDDPGHEIVQHELFGPVLVVQTASDWDEAIALLNGVSQGLVAALFSQSQKIIEAFLHEARAGILKINQSTADAGLDVPFGGWKSSGIGPPEHGRFDREFFTRPQAIYPSP